MKRFNTPILALFLALISCGSSKYVEDIPYKFSYNPDQIKKDLGITETVEVEENEMDKLLTDEEIYLKEKYAIILNVSPKEINNYPFYAFIEEWINTPYTSEKNMSKSGLNMVPFVQALYNQVYKVKLPAASAAEIFRAEQLEKFTGRAFLEEGDLIFFRYSKDLPVSDIAIYLKNGKILMTNRSSGLAIFDFDSEYFQTRYLASGRVMQKGSEENPE